MARLSYTKPMILVAVGIFLFLVFLQYRYYTTPITPEPRSEEVMDRLVSGGPAKEGIPAIDEPVFESVQSADEYLDNASFGIDVEVNGKHRFFPFQILVWHELVNDTFAGENLLISYSPLTSTAVVFDRTAIGFTHTFGVSGDLIDNNTVMVDRETDSRWRQINGEAFDGPKKGTRLERYPATVMPWDSFKKTYPGSAVLSRETGVVRDYTRDPYGEYQTNHAILFPLHLKDDRFVPKSLVYGIDRGTAQKAFFQEALMDQNVVNDHVGDVDVLVVSDTELKSVRAFDRRVGDRVLTFQFDDDVLVDKETQTRWNLDGEAFSGTLRGETLIAIPLNLSFWFSWYATYPETAVFNKN